MRITNRLAVLLVAAVMAGLLSSCSAPSGKTSPLSALFEDGRTLFYRTVRADVESHPGRDRLTPPELAKIRDLRTVYPRLYGLLVNYYYPKEGPALDALLAEGSAESMDRFRSRYLELSAFAAHMFAEALFEPSSHGVYFKDLIPRFKGKDTVDIVAMSTGHEADLHLPAPGYAPKPLSPEFDKQWGLDAGRFRTAHRLAKGRGVRVAVLDSGIDTSHPVFRDTIWGPHFNFVGRDGFPWAADGPPMVDWGWHGTIVTSIVAKYAPEVTITVYRDIDADTQNDSPLPRIVTSIMGAGIYKAVNDGNDVINISAGSNMDVAYLRDACRYAYENNVIIVTASPYYLGKYLGQDLDYPGQYPTNISVTGIARLAEGRYGYWDVAAPEATTWVGSPDAPFVAYPSYVDEKDDYAPGISCATPIVTSLVALIESVYPRYGTEPPGAYVDAVKKILAETADPEAVGFAGFSPDCGYGLIDADRAVRAAMALEARRGATPMPAVEATPAGRSSSDEAFLGGREVFYKELRLALGLHPERDRLLPAEISRLEKGPESLPALYGNAVNILFPKEAARLLGIREKGGDAEFGAAYEAFCREAADRFIESLFCESPDTQALLAKTPNVGRGRLDLVLSSLGSTGAPEPSFRSGLAAPDLGPAGPFGAAGFGEAHRTSRGKGLKVAVIDSGCDFEAPALAASNFDHRFDFSLTGRNLPPWSAEGPAVIDAGGRGTNMALVVSACAPEAAIRTIKITEDTDQPYEYWPAMQLAQAIYKAAADGADIIVTGASFSRDFPFLEEACQTAYLGNVLIFTPNGLTEPGQAADAGYPASYPSVLAAAGAVPAAGNRLAPWALSAPSKRTAVAAPAFVGRGPSNAYAASACAGLAALVSPLIPKTEKELPGQYVQRIAEILEKSADPRALGFSSFDPKIGYGLIDAPKSVGSGLQTYIKRMTALEEYFNKRMAERAKQAEEAAAKQAADKERSAANK